MSRSTLSVCMIVKNEEKFLSDCLASVRPVADQIVVLDTGSTDRTVEIVKEFGAEVHHFEWIEDFAAARNESIKYATSDWILWLDADERLRPESIPELKSLLQNENKPTAFVVQIYNLLQDRKNYKISTAHRLFNNRKGICFEGRIHEQVAYSISRLGGQEKKCTVELEHLGYGLESAEQDKKNLRNRALLEQFVQDEPHNAYAHFTLAQHYGMTNRLDKAIQHYETALEKNDFQPSMQASLLNTMAEACHQFGDSARAIELLAASTRLFADQAGAYYLYYRIERDRGNLQKAIDWLMILLKKNQIVRKHGSKLSTEILLDDDKIYLSVATHYFELKDFPNAAAWFSRLSQNYTDALPVLEKRALALLNCGNFKEAEHILQKLNQHVPENDRYQEWYGTALIKNQEFGKAATIYESILQRHPANVEIKKRLAALYAKSGDLEKAASYLSQN